MKKSLTLYVEKDAIQEDGVIPLAVASDASTDRDGEVVDPAGMDFTNYERNPVLLYAHDYRSDPIGKTLAIKRDGSRILFTPKLAVDISERARMYHSMIKEGILNAFSIGFIAKEWSDRQNGDGSTNRVFTKTELLEISLVPVPANANALVLAREYVGKVEDEKEKEIGASIIKDMELVVDESKEKTIDEKLAEIQQGISEVKTIAEEAKTIATEANEKANEQAQNRVAANGENGEEKALTVKELIASPEFTRGVLATVDKVVGVGLRDAKSRKLA